MFLFVSHHSPKSYIAVLLILHASHFEVVSLLHCCTSYPTCQPLWSCVTATLLYFLSYMPATLKLCHCYIAVLLILHASHFEVVSLYCRWTSPDQGQRWQWKLPTWKLTKSVSECTDKLLQNATLVSLSLMWELQILYFIFQRNNLLIV